MRALLTIAGALTLAVSQHDSGEPIRPADGVAPPGQEPEPVGPSASWLPTLEDALLAVGMAAATMAVAFVVQRWARQWYRRRARRVDSGTSPTRPFETGGADEGSDPAGVEDLAPSPDRSAIPTHPPAGSGAVPSQTAGRTGSVEHAAVEHAAVEHAAVEPAAAEHGGLARGSAALEHVESSRVVLYDRRAKLRVPFVAQARLRWDDSELEVTTVDLSLGGVMCQLPPRADDRPVDDLAVGRRVRLTLPVRATTLDLSARVGWQRREGDGYAVGLQFLALPDDAFPSLQAAIVDAVGE